MRRAELDDFLPASLAIEARPPSPVGRGLLWLIVLLCVAAVGWSIAGRVDIVTTASGRVIPAGHSRPVQAPRPGQVESVRVAEGDHVAEGDVLVDLDVEQARADLARIDIEIDGIDVDVARYRWLLDLLARDQQGIEVAAGDPGDTTAQGWWQQYLDERAVLWRERQQRVAEKRQTERQLEKLQAIQPLVEEIAADERGLAEQKLLAAHRMLQSEQRRLEVLHDLRIVADRIVEQDRALDAIDARSRLLRSEREREWRDRIDTDMRRREGLRHQRVKAQEQLQRSRVTAPVSGRVQQLAVHGPGAVVGAGQTL
ncbi:MAG: biotin/lipoyl-binding protein, partial [Gammaproteobacteria bacterium]|nr:biotin/lipoyl-binding protein [Gammaproteobacteria bacterium]